MSYLSLDTLKATLDLSGQSYADADITAAISSASKAIDFICKRRGTASRLAFEQDADANQTRYYSPERLVSLDVDDLVTFTALSTDPSGDGTFADSWALNVDFNMEPLNAAAEDRPYERIVARPNGSFLFPTTYPRSVQLVGKFGWPTVPDGIVEGTSILAAKLLKRAREAPFGVIAVNMDGAAVRIARSDPDIMVVVGDYIKRKVVVG